MQRARLMKDCVPVVFFVVVTIGLPWVLETMGGATVPSAFFGFMAVVILLCGWTAWSRFRDLQSGVAVVVEDRLIRSGRARHRSRFWGQFERLGRLRLTARAHGTGRHGAVNRVVYSPASKIVWTLEPVA
jgi:hypothetical protein